MRKYCCVLLALLPMSAFAYSTDVTKKIEGVSIDYTRPTSTTTSVRYS
jgi:hypothetical protein